VRAAIQYDSSEPRVGGLAPGAEANRVPFGLLVDGGPRAGVSVALPEQAVSCAGLGPRGVCAGERGEWSGARARAVLRQPGRFFLALA